MTDQIKEFYGKFNKDMGRLQKEIPDTLQGFGGLFSKVMTDGAMSLREKELAALAIAVATQCQSCIRLHVKKCLEAGADKKQILEAASVAVMMTGGPAYTQLPEVLNTLEALD